MFHEALDAAFVFEQVALALAPLVDQFDLDAGVEEAQFAQALGQDVVVEFDVGEDLGVGQEAQLGAALGRRAHHLERVHRLAHRVFLLVVLAVAPDVEPQLRRQRVDHGNAHAVQAAGHLVAVVVELTAGVQHGHDDLGCGDALFLVDVGRDAAAVVGHRAGAVVVQGHDQVVAVPGQRFVNAVVHHLEHHVVQAGAVVHVADVHAGALADGLQAAQDGDLAGIVGVGRDLREVRLIGHCWRCLALGHTGSQAARKATARLLIMSWEYSA